MKEQKRCPLDYVITRNCIALYSPWTLHYPQGQFSLSNEITRDQINRTNVELFFSAITRLASKLHFVIQQSETSRTVILMYRSRRIGSWRCRQIFQFRDYQCAQFHESEGVSLIIYGYGMKSAIKCLCKLFEMCWCRAEEYGSGGERSYIARVVEEENMLEEECARKNGSKRRSHRKGNDDEDDN